MRLKDKEQSDTHRSTVRKAAAVLSVLRLAPQHWKWTKWRTKTCRTSSLTWFQLLAPSWPRTSKYPATTSNAIFVRRSLRRHSYKRAVVAWRKIYLYHRDKYLLRNPMLHQNVQGTALRYPRPNTINEATGITSTPGWNFNDSPTFLSRHSCSIISNYIASYWKITLSRIDSKLNISTDFFSRHDARDTWMALFLANSSMTTPLKTLSCFSGMDGIHSPLQFTEEWTAAISYRFSH